MQGRVNSVAALLTACALLSGCGSSSPPDPTAKFKKSYTPLHQQFQQTAQAIDRAVQQIGSQSDAQLGATFHDLSLRWQAQLDRLQKLKPPTKEVSDDFNMLIITATSVEGGLVAAETDAVTHDLSAGQRVRANLLTPLAAARSADAALAQKLALK
jgi:membrane-bound lytic murein transglycosylase B